MPTSDAESFDIQAAALKGAVNTVLKNNPNAVASNRFKVEQSSSYKPKSKVIHQRSRIGLRSSNPYLTKSNQESATGFATQWKDSVNILVADSNKLQNVLGIHFF